ncbi:MAG: hypothetical protein HY918_05650 [Candidatus Doudnabacteria bacterium]|nr:hypothetical protein [Candidatus Doudnabacteria bacterium]
MKIKYFIFILVTAVCPLTFVQAAKQVTGTVPEVQPVQPAPEGISPNVSKNIQFQDESHEGQFDAQGNVVNDNQAPQNLDESSHLVASALPVKIVAAGSSWWKYALVLLLLLGGGFVYWQVNRKKS